MITDGARGLTTKYTKVTKWGGVYWPRNDTEDHGIGDGMMGACARGLTTKDTEGTKRTGGNRGG